MNSNGVQFDSQEMNQTKHPEFPSEVLALLREYMAVTRRIVRSECIENLPEDSTQKNSS